MGNTTHECFGLEQPFLQRNVKDYGRGGANECSCLSFSFDGQWTTQKAAREMGIHFNYTNSKRVNIWGLAGESRLAPAYDVVAVVLVNSFPFFPARVKLSFGFS